MDKCFLYGNSVNYHRIEAWRTFLKKSNSSWWMDFLKDLRGQCFFWAQFTPNAWGFCFMPFVQEELQKIEIAVHWNLQRTESDHHRIWNAHRAVQMYSAIFQNGEIQRPLIWQRPTKMTFLWLQIYPVIDQFRLHGKLIYIILNATTTIKNAFKSSGGPRPSRGIYHIENR